MRYFAVPAIGILVFACAAGLAGAQGLASPLGAGPPFLSGLTGGGCAPGCDPQARGGVSFDIGYLTTNRGVVFELTGQPSVGLVSLVRHDFIVDGLWLAVSANAHAGDRIGVFARGSWLVPSTRKSGRLLQFGNTLEPGEWRTKVQWYNADLAGTFSPHSALTFVGGFRFDSFDTKFHDRELIDVDDLSTDQTYVTVTSYIPYVGIVVNQGPALRVGVIGFPYVPGTVSYEHNWGNLMIRHEATGSFSQSYFLEAFAEYGRQLMGGNLGIFGMWTYLHGSSSLQADRTVGGAAATSGAYQFTVDRQNWIFGVKFGLNFSTPI